VVPPSRVEEPTGSSQKQGPEQQCLGDVPAMRCASLVRPEGSWERSPQRVPC
jgi:hypothetical protein